MEATAFGSLANRGRAVCRSGISRRPSGKKNERSASKDVACIFLAEEVIPKIPTPNHHPTQAKYATGTSACRQSMTLTGDRDTVWEGCDRRGQSTNRPGDFEGAFPSTTPPSSCKGSQRDRDRALTWVFRFSLGCVRRFRFRAQLGITMDPKPALPPQIRTCGITASGSSGKRVRCPSPSDF